MIARKEWGIEGLINPIANIRKPGGHKLLENFRTSDNPYLASAFVLAIETSLRQGMLFNLRWEWGNFDNALINIQVGLR